MLSTIAGYVQSLITLVGNFVTAIFSSGGALADLKELMLIGVTVSLGLVAVKFIRKIMWGN